MWGHYQQVAMMRVQDVSRWIRNDLVLTLSLWVYLCILVLNVPARADSPTATSAYRLGPNDVVRIQVFGEDDLTIESKVGGDGTINFPLLGTVSLAGKNVSEAQDFLRSRLAEGYVRSPRVTLQMVRYRNVYVNGEVKTAGGYPFEFGLTIQKAVSMAGGFTDKAETRQVTVTRSDGGSTEVITLGGDAAVLPDDIIVVGHLRKIYVTGDVVHPGPYPYEDQLTVKKALSLAGGMTEKADPGGLKVTRLKETGAETDGISLEGTLLPDDLLFVEGQHRRVYVSGEVKQAGSYPYKEGLTVQKALAIAGGLTEKAEKGSLQVTRANGAVVDTIVISEDAQIFPDDLIVVPQAKRVYVNGEVKAPGSFAFEKGLTVHKAITLAGGFTDKAAKGSTKVLRVINGKEQMLDSTLDALVVADDIIVVPQRFF